MKKKLVIVVLLALVVLISYFLFVDVSESRFTDEDTNAELRNSEASDTKRSNVVQIVNSIPTQNETEIVRGDSSSYDECAYSGVNIKSGSKSRYCEKVVVAYIGVSKSDKDSVLAYVLDSFNRNQKFAALSKSDDNSVEEYYSQKDYSKSKLQVKVQSKDKNDFNSIPDLLERHEYVVDIYYYDKYSEIRKPMNIFEYL